MKSTLCEACERNHLQSSLQSSLEEELVARAKINGIKTGEELFSEAFTSFRSVKNTKQKKVKERERKVPIVHISHLCEMDVLAKLLGSKCCLSESTGCEKRSF